MTILYEGCCRGKIDNPEGCKGINCPMYNLALDWLGENMHWDINHEAPSQETILEIVEEVILKEDDNK